MNQEYLYNIHEYQLIPDSEKEACIQVFTSKTCPFCKKALEIVNEVVENMDIYEAGIRVVERKVEDYPEKSELYSIFAVPFILIGSSSIVGLPNEDEVQDLIHQAMLAEAFKTSK